MGTLSAVMDAFRAGKAYNVEDAAKYEDAASKAVNASRMPSVSLGLTSISKGAGSMFSGFIDIARAPARFVRGLGVNIPTQGIVGAGVGIAILYAFLMVKGMMF